MLLTVVNRGARVSNPRQGRELSRDFCSTSSHLSYNEYTDRTLSVGSGLATCTHMLGAKKIDHTLDSLKAIKRLLFSSSILLRLMENRGTYENNEGPNL